MSNGVSVEAKNARDVFKIPGEGAYELRSELQSPTVPTAPSANNATRTAQTSSQASATTAAALGGPLGLAHATFTAITGELASTSDAAASGGKGTSVSAPNTPERSLRSKPPLVKKFGIVSSLSRFGSQGPSDFSSSKSAKNSSATDISIGDIDKQNTRERDLNYIIAYNSGDVLCTSNSKDDECVQTLKFRSPITALAASNGLKLLVGCANGEVYYYPDVTTLPTKGSNPTPTSAMAMIGGGISGTLYNKDGQLDATRVVSLQWLPGSTTKFAAVHIDGGLFVYDIKHRGGGTAKSSRSDGVEEWKTTFNSTTTPSNMSAGTAGSVAPGTPSAVTPSSVSSSNATASSGNGYSSGSSVGAAGQPIPVGPGLGTTSELLPRGGSHKRASSPANFLGQHQIAVSHPPRGKRGNPVLQMQIGKGGINAAAFSPEVSGQGTYLALACRDGYLRIVDFDKEQLIMCLRSYYGALLCAAWSHDGKYLATGGEDDLISIWCPSEASIVARLEGHSSWISSVAWDETSHFSSRYRLGSAGQDAKLALWDFTVDALHRRTHHRPSKTKISTPSTASSQSNNGKSLGNKISRGIRGSAGLAPSGSSADSSDSASAGLYIQKEALGRAEVPIIEPIIDHIAHNEPMTSIAFTADAVVTACTGGVVRVWWKPPLVPAMPLPSGSVRSESNSANFDIDLNGMSVPPRVDLD